MKVINYNGSKIELTLKKTKRKKYVYYHNTYDFRVALEGDYLMIDIFKDDVYEPFDKLIIDKYVYKSTIYNTVLNMLTEEL
jgi:hypothetical protein